MDAPRRDGHRRRTLAESGGLGKLVPSVRERRLERAAR